jgi:ABC-type oligopeptide transport system substrate-binding subunit
MLMKSHKFVGACFAVVLFLLIAACSANNSATTVQNASVTKVVEFEVVGQLENQMVRSSEDKIIKISKPFLEWSIDD